MTTEAEFEAWRDADTLSYTDAQTVAAAVSAAYAPEILSPPASSDSNTVKTAWARAIHDRLTSPRAPYVWPVGFDGSSHVAHPDETPVDEAFLFRALVAAVRVYQHAPDAPAAVRGRAVQRLAGYEDALETRLAVEDNDGGFMPMPRVTQDAFKASGAAAMLRPWRRVTAKVIRT